MKVNDEIYELLTKWANYSMETWQQGYDEERARNLRAVRDELDIRGVKDTFIENIDSEYLTIRFKYRGNVLSKSISIS